MRPWILLPCALLVACGRAASRAPVVDPPVATFSIVAFDPATGDLGVAVQSKVFGVGSIVPYVRADVGAVATQAFAEPAFGPEGLDLLDDGTPASSALEALLRLDTGRARRQLGIVDAHGRAAAFTGEGCHPWAGHVMGEHYCCQGNLLAGPGVVNAMAAAFEQTRGPLAERLLAALRAGQAAGGDKRGRQSAALMVARRFGGYRGRNDRYLDIRVEDHKTPIEELGRLLGKRRAFLPEPAVPRQVADLVREPRVGTSGHPSARDTWRRWKALRRAQDWVGIHALCASSWRELTSGPPPDVKRLERVERQDDTPQAKARRGVYLGTAFDGARARLHFAVRGEAQPVVVLLLREQGAWRIIP